jgi:hypothetical protein
MGMMDQHGVFAIASGSEYQQQYTGLKACCYELIQHLWKLEWQ